MFAAFPDRSLPIRSAIFLVSISCVLSVFAAARQGPGRPSGASPVREAGAELAGGNAASAASLLTSWLQANPRDTTARLLLGEADEAERDIAGAEAQFQFILRHDPMNSRALTALGALYDHQHDPQRAEPFLARAVKVAPRSPSARLGWAAVLAELHRYHEAAAALRGVAAPESEGGKISYLRLKAAVALGNGQAGDAARHMESALAIAPENHNLRLATGVSEFEAGNWSRASALLGPLFQATRDPRCGLYLLEAQIRSRAGYSSTLDELRALAPRSGQEAAVRDAIGNVLAKSGLDAEALEDFKAAAAAAPTDQGAVLELAAAQLRAGQLDAAYAAASRAAALQDNASAESLLGEIEEKRGKNLAAVHHDQNAVTLDPQEEQYWLGLGMELLRHETDEPALAVFKQAAARFPCSVRVRVALGMTQYFLHQYPEAIRSLLTASRAGRDSPLAINFLGQIQLQPQVTPDPDAVRAICQFASAHPRGGDAMAYCGALAARVAHDRGDLAPPEALKNLRLAAASSPHSAIAHCELGKALEWAKQWREAGEQLAACVRIEPEFAEGHYHLAQVYLHERKAVLARQQMKLHDETVKHMIASNAQHDATLKKFLYTLGHAGEP